MEDLQGGINLVTLFCFDGVDNGWLTLSCSLSFHGCSSFFLGCSSFFLSCSSFFLSCSSIFLSCSLYFDRRFNFFVSSSFFLSLYCILGPWLRLETIIEALVDFLLLKSQTSHATWGCVVTLVFVFFSWGLCQHSGSCPNSCCKNGRP